MIYDLYPEKIPELLSRIVASLPLTLEIAALALVLALVLGTVVAAAQLSSSRIARRCARVWVTLVRGVPTLVMLFLLYFGLPQVIRALTGVSIATIDKAWFVIAALGIIASANTGETMRSALQAVPDEQREAAYAVGMTKRQALLRIIAPQALRIGLPPFGNIIVSLLKQTSLAFSIGVIDLMGRATAIAAANSGAYKLELYVSVALTYWIICLIVSVIFGLLGQHGFSKHMTRAGR